METVANGVGSHLKAAVLVLQPYVDVPSVLA